MNSTFNLPQPSRSAPPMPNVKPPKIIQYAVIMTENVHHEGDERSRTHPGHGYPAYDEEKEVIKLFKNREDFVEWVTSNSGRPYGPKFTAIKYEVVKVSTKIHIDVDE